MNQVLFSHIYFPFFEILYLLSCFYNSYFPSLKSQILNPVYPVQKICPIYRYPFMPQIILSPSPFLNSKFYILNSLYRQFIPKGSLIPTIPFAQLNSAFNI